jgi:Uma2 family endonuclease
MASQRSQAGPAAGGALAAVLEGQRRLRVDEYHRMIDAGVLRDDEPVELVEGILLSVTPQGPRHARVIQRLNRVLVRAVGDDLAVLPQLPLTLGELDEPEPDLAIVRASDASSDQEHPRTALLVVEVADASLARDRGVKAAAYARGGVREYWIVDVTGQRVEVYRDPDIDAGRYRSLAEHDRSSRLTPECLPGLTIPVDEILGGVTPRS